ncbi:2-deoxyribose-5-phosphate aldolase [Anaerosporomusa subterranea]|uniref:Deoxyribose-phosphate aldolase n=1 Tax=Anaerosporomusa subterranea TaxID=1794912 RepID=A0A154BLJ9_ANASB|nr:2-deoxyribose-5-phosphate aldolase [Anaerosporomusa subterranea]
MAVDLAKYIDHTILKPEASIEQIRVLCQEAAEHGFAAVCVNPVFVDLAAHLLRGSGVKVATVVGFPLGATLTEIKAAETKAATERRADEIDMVINLGAVKSGAWDAVESDIRAVVEAAEGRTVKVIIETCLLTNEEKRRACEAALAAGAHFVKTSTGFSSSGATVEDILLMKEVVGDKALIKASGGVRNREQALAMIAAGASRIGTSAGVTIVTI